MNLIKISVLLTTMNTLVNSLNNLSFEDDLPSIDSLNIDDDEDNEEHYILIDMLNTKVYHRDMIKETKIRYLRYLKEINVWRINGISYEYIKIQIDIFLKLASKMYKKDTQEMLEGIRYIDNQLKQFT